MFDRDRFAQWYAHRHFETDTGVERIVYLPTDSPPREIRFVEVNRMISETTPLEPIDFGVAIVRAAIGFPCGSNCSTRAKAANWCGSSTAPSRILAIMPN
jgi:hypothetical protein